MPLPSVPTLTTLVTGENSTARESAILAALKDAPAGSTALILEGLPAGVIATAAELPALMHVAHIAPGCVCCTGNLTMRVTLNRILRQSPQRLYIALATSAHLETIRAFLSATPYDTLLVLTQDLQA